MRKLARDLMLLDPHSDEFPDADANRIELMEPILRRLRSPCVVIDHQNVVVTGANLSRSAEERNVELGLRLDEPLLARSIENQMRALEPYLSVPQWVQWSGKLGKLGLLR